MSRREARRRRVSRRRFIGLAAGGVVAVGAAAFGAVELLSGGDTKRRAQPPGSSTTTSSTVVAPAETVPAGDDSPLARIARRYLEITPEEASKDALRAALPPEFVGTGGPTWAALQEQVAADFAAGELVTLDGWRLARTEARAAALVALGGATG